MDSKPVSVRLNEKQKANLRKHFGNTSAGASAVADIMGEMDGMMEFFDTGKAALTWGITTMPTLVYQAWKEIAGGFTKSELILIAQAMAQTEETPTGHVCLAKISDVIASCRALRPEEGKPMERTHKTILIKLHQLSSFQRVSLECWARMFWKNRTRRNSGRESRFLKMLGVG